MKHNFETTELGLGVCKNCGAHRTNPQWPIECKKPKKLQDMIPKKKCSCCEIVHGDLYKCQGHAHLTACKEGKEKPKTPEERWREIKEEGKTEKRKYKCDCRDTPHKKNCSIWKSLCPIPEGKEETRANYCQVGPQLECGHCKPEKGYVTYENFKCECVCHQESKNMATPGNSGAIVVEAPQESKECKWGHTEEYHLENGCGGYYAQENKGEEIDFSGTVISKDGKTMINKGFVPSKEEGKCECGCEDQNRDLVNVWDKKCKYYCPCHAPQENKGGEYPPLSNKDYSIKVATPKPDSSWEDKALRLLNEGKGRELIKLMSHVETLAYHRGYQDRLLIDNCHLESRKEIREAEQARILEKINDWKETGSAREVMNALVQLLTNKKEEK